MLRGGLSRRTFCTMATSAMISAPAWAQSYPDRPIRIVVPFGPGGLADTTTRIVADKLTSLIGQQIVVLNQPGANGLAAGKLALAAPADGYTLILLTNGTAVATALARSPAIDPARAFVPISSLGYFDFQFLTGAQSPHRTLDDFIAAGRASPGKLNIGSINVGSTQNLSAVLFRSLARIDAAVVPFRTSPEVMTAAIRGDVDMVVEGYATAKALIAEGQLRALASTGATRSPNLPDVPTVMEAGVAGFEVTSWNALFAPAGTPAPVVAFLNAKILEALDAASVRERVADLGIQARGSTPEQIGRRLEDDTRRWTRVVDEAGIPRN